jgi:pheromone shutdown protein TraB
LGAGLALAHPLTIIVAFLAAPFTSLNPLLRSGWIAGLVEALIHKPRVSDFETIGDDILSVRGVWKNRVSKILLVVALTNICTMIGAVLGLGQLAAMIG